MKKNLNNQNSNPRRRREAQRPAAEHEPGLLENFQRNLRRSKIRFSSLVREKRADQFPESERFFTELLLFLWGLLPLLRCRLRELGQGHRKKKIHSSHRLRAYLESLKIRPVTYVVGACTLAAVALFFSSYT